MVWLVFVIIEKSLRALLPKVPFAKPRHHLSNVNFKFLACKLGLTNSLANYTG